MIIITHELIQLVKDNNAFIVLTKSLAYRASFDSDQSSFPSHKKIMEDTGFSKPTVIKALEYLEAIGIIKIKRSTKNRAKQVNQYYIITDLIKTVGKMKLGVVNKIDQGSKNNLPGVVKEIYINHKSNLTTSPINHSSLSEIEKKYEEVKKHPLYETIYNKLKNKNLNDEEVDSEIKVALYKYIEEGKSNNIITYLNNWFANVKYQWKPKKAKWEIAQEAEEYYQSNSNYDNQNASIADLFQGLDESNDDFEQRAKEQSQLYGTKYRLHYNSQTLE